MGDIGVTVEDRVRQHWGEYIQAQYLGDVDIVCRVIKKVHCDPTMLRGWVDSSIDDIARLNGTEYGRRLRKEFGFFDIENPFAHNESPWKRSLRIMLLVHDNIQGRYKP